MAQMIRPFSTVDRQFQFHHGNKSKVGSPEKKKKKKKKRNFSPLMLRSSNSPLPRSNYARLD